MPLGLSASQGSVAKRRRFDYSKVAKSPKTDSDFLSSTDSTSRANFSDSRLRAFMWRLLCVFSVGKG
ncbi:unnamed protein product [Rhodiola kirilowii]